MDSHNKCRDITTEIIGEYEDLRKKLEKQLHEKDRTIAGLQTQLESHKRTICEMRNEMEEDAARIAKFENPLTFHGDRS